MFESGCLEFINLQGALRSTLRERTRLKMASDGRLDLPVLGRSGFMTSPQPSQAMRREGSLRVKEPNSKQSDRGGIMFSILKTSEQQ